MQRETKAQRDERVNRILALLDEEYGTDYRCYLNHETPWQLLIAVIMSAQCTDARVNIVTADLFKKYDTLEKFANADLKELEKDIHSTGFYHMKAKNIIACCKSLVENFGGEVPRTLEELTSLAGVGRKTAMKVLPKEHWILWNIQIITLGRSICIARSPKCGECFLRENCPGAEKRK